MKSYFLIALIIIKVTLECTSAYNKYLSRIYQQCRIVRIMRIMRITKIMKIIR